MTEATPEAGVLNENESDTGQAVTEDGVDDELRGQLQRATDALQAVNETL